MISRIVTGDESWVYEYEPESKVLSMEWRERGSCPPVKPRTAISAGKHMCTFFWDQDGPLLIKWLPKGVTINSDYYTQVLQELRQAIKSERRGKLSKGVLLLHDNARPHTSQQTSTAIRDLGYEVVPHPPYSPDLAPSDFWLFGPMKKALRGKRFYSLQQLATSVSKWARETPKEWYSAGLQKLPDRWTTCIQRKGDWVEIGVNEDSQ